MKIEVKHPTVNVRLVGGDGNAAIIIGKVRAAIHRQVGKAEADAFANEAFEAGSYDELLQLCMKTVNVS